MRKEISDWKEFDSSDWYEVNTLVSALSKSSCPVKLISKRLHCKLLPQHDEEKADFDGATTTCVPSQSKSLHNIKLQKPNDQLKKPTASITTNSIPNTIQSDSQHYNLPCKKNKRNKVLLVCNDIHFSEPSKYSNMSFDAEVENEYCCRPMATTLLKNTDVKEMSEFIFMNFV